MSGRGKANLTTGVGCRIEAFSTNGNRDKKIIFGNNVQINDYVHISAMEKVGCGPSHFKERGVQDVQIAVGYVAVMNDQVGRLKRLETDVYLAGKTFRPFRIFYTDYWV